MPDRLKVSAKDGVCVKVAELVPPPPPPLVDGLTATALRAHFLPGLLQDMTVFVPVAGSVLPAERISPTLVVPVVQREV